MVNHLIFVLYDQSVQLCIQEMRSSLNEIDIVDVIVYSLMETSVQNSIAVQSLWNPFLLHFHNKWNTLLIIHVAGHV